MSNPIVTEVTALSTMDVVVKFDDGTEIRLTPRKNSVGAVRGLNQLVVTREGRAIARYMGERYSFDTGTEHDFEYIESPATPQLVREYCVAAGEYTYSHMFSSVAHSVLSEFWMEFMNMGNN